MRCADSNGQIPALDRSQPILPLSHGQAAKQLHDYPRQSTTVLLAALEVATGNVTDACYPRHREVEFLKVLKVVAQAEPERHLHLVVDNPGAHDREEVRKWQVTYPRIESHVTPTGLLMDEPGRVVVLDHHPPSHPLRIVHRCTRGHRRDPHVHRCPQRCVPFVRIKTVDDTVEVANRNADTVTDHYRFLDKADDPAWIADWRVAVSGGSGRDSYRGSAGTYDANQYASH